MKLFLIAALALLGLTSCNTMIGVGRDFRKLGEGMEHSAHGRNFDGSDRGRKEEPLPTY